VILLRSIATRLTPQWLNETESPVMTNPVVDIIGLEKCGIETGPLRISELTPHAVLSAAISLKRIADALQHIVAEMAHERLQKNRL
jgi:hypothetical protein